MFLHFESHMNPAIAVHLAMLMCVYLGTPSMRQKQCYQIFNFLNFVLLES